MRTRGKFIFKETWYSFCSKHREYDADCNICQHGTWENNIKHFFDSLIFKLFPRLWMWQINKDIKNGRKRNKR